MALALDGTPVHVTGATSPVTSGTFTTANGSGVIIVAITSNATSITGVTATGLTFSARKQIGPTSGASRVQTWEAPYSTNFSGTIQIAMGSNATTTADIFAVSGCPTASFHDTGAGIPGSSTSGNSTITTTNANDFVYFLVTNSTTNGTAGATWNQIGPGSNFQVAAYQIVAATGTFTTALATGTSRGSIIDAIIASAAPTDPGTVGMIGITRLGSIDWRWT